MTPAPKHWEQARERSLRRSTGGVAAPAARPLGHPADPPTVGLSPCVGLSRTVAGRELDTVLARDASREPWRRVARGARRVGTALLLLAVAAAAVGLLPLLARHGPSAGLGRAVSAAWASPAGLSGPGLLVHVATLLGLAGTWCWGLALVLAGLFER